MHTTLNLRLTSKILATIVCIIAVAMLPAGLASLYFQEYATARALGMSAFLFFVLGMFVRTMAQPTKLSIQLREGSLIVGLSWILASLVGCIPYLLSGYTNSFSAAFFESAAGFTTTGGTAFDLGLMPRGLMLWKAICTWLGGMGILVFLVTLLPSLGISGQKIFRAESPGIKIDKISSRISDSAKILYLIYIGLTVIEFLLLALGSNMAPFDAAVNTLGSISTSGIFSHPQGLAYYDSVYVELVISVFTVLSSVSFVLYPLLLQGEFKRFFKNPELRVFAAIIATASVVVTCNLYLSHMYDSFPESLRYAFFQVTSFSSTSGYAITDYTSWPLFSKLILMLLMMIGGCSASTSGSIKIIRIIVMFKLIQRSIYKRMHPRAVLSLKLSGTPLQEDVIAQTASFIFAFFAMLAAGSMLLSLQIPDIEITFSTALAMLSNTGIAFGATDYSGYFGFYNAPLKMVLSTLMIFGRLEIFTVLMLFVPSFWNADRAKSL